MVKSQMSKKVFVGQRLDPVLHKQVKMLAVERGITLEELIRQSLQDTIKKDKRKRSRATANV